jgi:diguanylate cyclase (GGDEF)-like protein
MSAKQRSTGHVDADRNLIHAQLVENASVVRASVTGNLINVGACGALLAYYDALGLFIALSAPLFLSAIVLWRLATARKILASTPTDPRLLAWLRQIKLTGAILGSFWGLITFLILSAGIHATELVGGIVGAGMMSAGAMAFRTVRQAAWAYVICCAVGGIIGLLTIDETGAYIGLVLMACYLVVLYSNIMATSERFDRAHAREQQLSEAADTIQLLLNDLTEQGTEWLLDVDHLGRIQSPCEKMIELTGSSATELSGLPFGRLLDPGNERDRLKQFFRDGKFIRRHMLPLTIDGHKKWLSLSARPKPGGQGYRGVITDMTAQRSAEERVSFLAHYDALTKLPNRMLFNDNVAHALKRHEGRVAIMYLDLDNFKSINDTLGHPVGDKVLAEVARRIETAIGQYDLASRFGGDEFVVLVSGSRIDKVDHLAARIIKELAAPIVIDQVEMETCCSIGIAVGPEDGETSDALIRKADLALYAAKSDGRGQAMRFVPEMDEAARARRSIEHDLRNALRCGEFEVHYQPLMNVKSASVAGFEALVRWHHPERGIIMPNSFIPIAEETGLIVSLGEWVIRKAIADAAKWPDHITISINLSPVQVRSPVLLGILMHAAASNCVAPERICLEITESVLMQDSEANIQALHRLRDFGMHISLDDFGTGYSSLNYLRTFPFSKIKIDRCFVSEIEENRDCQAIVRSVISLAGSLGMTTVAEGIERETQAALLKGEGCSELQGFLYSKAVPADQVSEYFKPSRDDTIAA